MKYSIPLFDLNFDEAEEKAVLETIQSKWISTGPKVEQFERKFANLLDVKYAAALSNCTVSLHLALKLANIGEGDEVICPSLTFVATVNAIRYVNATPVFADITSYQDLTISPEDIERNITPRTKAIIVMHYAGFACQMDRIMEIASAHNLKVIEDACHAPLSTYNGKKLGTIGDIGCFSFFSNKNISTGEGGMLITNNEDYFKRAKLLRSHGMTSMSYERSTGHSTEYDVVELGYNYRMDDMRASIGIVQVGKLEEDLISRAIVRDKYLEVMEPIDKIYIPFKDHRGFVSNYIFPIVLKNSNRQYRDQVRARLHGMGIQTSIHYPAVHRFSIYKEFNSELPVTEYVTDNEITLPMYGKLNIDDISYIATSLNTVLS